MLGRDPVTDGPAIRARMGLVPQEDSLDLDLTVLDNLMIYGRYFDMPRKLIRQRADQLLEFAQLTERAHERLMLTRREYLELQQNLWNGLTEVVNQAVEPLSAERR